MAQSLMTAGHQGRGSAEPLDIWTASCLRPTKENCFDSVLEKYLEKDIPVLQKSMHEVTAFLKQRVHLTCFGKS